MRTIIAVLVMAMLSGCVVTPAVPLRSGVYYSHPVPTVYRVYHEPNRPVYNAHRYHR